MGFVNDHLVVGTFYCNCHLVLVLMEKLDLTSCIPAHFFVNLIHNHRISHFGSHTSNVLFQL